MTTIKLALNDQRLFALNKVTLASGDINSVQMEVEFCDAWDDFPVRFAHFAVQTADRLVLSSQTDTIPDVLMIDNKAIIPAAALAESGVLYVGVYADSTDGTARKTSIGECKFVIHKGATGAKTTVAPEVDAFMQYLAAMDAKIDPLMTAAVEQMKATMTAHHEALAAAFDEQLNELKQYVKGEVLWSCEDNLADELKFIAENCYPYGTMIDRKEHTREYAFDASKYHRFTVVFSIGGNVQLEFYRTTEHDTASWSNGNAIEGVVENSQRWRVGEIAKNEPHPVPYTAELNETYQSGYTGSRINIEEFNVVISDTGATARMRLVPIKKGTEDHYDIHICPFVVAIIGYKDPSLIEVPDIEFE